MVDKEKIEWAKRAFAEIARDCEEMAAMDTISFAEMRDWKARAANAKRNIKILEQP